MKNKEEVDAFVSLSKEKLLGFVRMYKSAIKADDDTSIKFLVASMSRDIDDTGDILLELITNSPTEKNNMQILNGYVIHTDSLTVVNSRNNDDKFDLKPREIKIILRLMKNQNEVVTFSGFKDDTQFKNLIHKLRGLFGVGPALRKSGEFAAVLSRV